VILVNNIKLLTFVNSFFKGIFKYLLYIVIRRYKKYFTNFSSFDIIYIVGDLMKIEKIKKVGSKYKIIFDDKTVLNTYDDVLINNSLLYNNEIDSKLLNKLNNDTDYYDIYYKTVNYITKKLRSEKEVNEFIDKNNTNDKDKKQVISKLKEIGLINDINYVKAYISDRINLSNDGPLKIKKSLLEHDIDSDVIEDELSKIDNNLLKEKLNKLINKKISNTKYSGYILRQKLYNDFINLGYSKEMINEIYDNIEVNKTGLLKKEYDKLYKKLSVKYSGRELENKIKSKLYQKGFTIDEINNTNYL